MTTQHSPDAASIESLPIVQADWAAMSLAEQRTYFGDNGFLVIPGAVDAAGVQTLLCELEALGSPLRLECELWDVPGFVPLVDNARVLTVVRNLLGADLRFFKAAYTSTPPGSACQKLHLDQNTSGYPGDYRNTSASWINVGIYLTNLSTSHAPLWVVPAVTSAMTCCRTRTYSRGKAKPKWCWPVPETPSSSTVPLFMPPEPTALSTRGTAYFFRTGRRGQSRRGNYRNGRSNS